MRVLFAVIPEKNTFLHTVPLAWALRTAGHDVRVASAPCFTDTITQAGLTAVPVGRDASIWRVDGLNAELLEQARIGLPPPWNIVERPDDVEWPDLVEGYRIATHEGHKLENFPIVSGMVEFARYWQPDLVIWEPLSYVGAVVAKACGAAHARMLWSLDVLGLAREHFLRLRAEQAPDAQDDPLGEWLGGYGRKYGFDFTEDMTTGQFTIDQMPESLRMRADGLHYVPIQFVPYGGAAVVPKWLQTPPERTRIGLTLGTTATDRFAGYTVGVADILDALSDLDVEVVATIAESAQEKLGAVPPNARVVPYVPLDVLAPTCSAIIDHAGPATFLTAARHGVPQLTLPSDFDEPELGRRAAAQGGSITLDHRAASGQDVREQVLRLLHEPGFRDGADRLRTEIRGLPTPNELVDQLEELTPKYQGG